MLRLSLELLKKLACSPQGRQLQSLEARGLLVGSLGANLTKGEKKRSQLNLCCICSRCSVKLRDTTLGDVQQHPLQDGPCLLLRPPKVPAFTCCARLSLPEFCLSSWPDNPNKSGNGLMSRALQRSSQMVLAAAVPI